MPHAQSSQSTELSAIPRSVHFAPTGSAGHADAGAAPLHRHRDALRDRPAPHSAKRALLCEPGGGCLLPRRHVDPVPPAVPRPVRQTGVRPGIHHAALRTGGYINKQ
eukprot:3740344-Pyramimonas_sp.AAC.1